MLFCAWRARWVAVCLLGFLSGRCLRAETAILQIKVLHGDGGVYPAGTRPPQGIVVQVTDETGGPVEGARLSFLLPEDGPSGSFAPGIRTAIIVSGPDGKAAAPSPMLGHDSGPLRVRVVAAKDQARAGLVVNQFVSPPARMQAASSALREAQTPQVRRGGRGRVLMILGAAAAGGLALGLSRQGSGRAPTAAPAAALPRIGSPAITVGRP